MLKSRNNFDVGPWTRWPVNLLAGVKGGRLNFSVLSVEHIHALRGIVSPERVSAGESVLDLHARDQSPHPARRPEAVVWPNTAAEVASILKYADHHRMAVTGWGAGSSLEGNPIPVRGGIVLDFSQMNRILSVREEDFQVDLEPGVVYQDLNTKIRHSGLFFPPDPGARATIGGMIANNASGTRTVLYGSTRDHVLRLKVALAGGEIIELGSRASKSSSGYDLLHLFTGSEGTLGVVVEATLRLVGLPAEYSAAVATFPSVEAAAKAVYDLKRSGLNPAALELLGPECIPLMNADEHLGLKVAPTLFIEFHGATLGQLAEALETAQEICSAGGGLEFRPGLGRSERDGIFKARHGLYEMIVRRHPNCRILVMDVAVPLTAYPELLAAMQTEIEENGLTGYVMSHAGNGNVHLDILAARDDAAMWELVQEVSGRLVMRTISLGGTATGEHGVGLGKRKYMLAEHGTSLAWMRRVKELFDPNGILNPGKIFPD
jgi:D-lactate dehydrogenase (cytochrome)